MYSLQAKETVKDKNETIINNGSVRCYYSFPGGNAEPRDVSLKVCPRERASVIT